MGSVEFRFIAITLWLSSVGQIDYIRLDHLKEKILKKQLPKKCKCERTMNIIP